MSTEQPAGTPLKNKLGCAILGIVAAAILAALLLPLISAARSAAHINSCNCRLKQFDLALLNYESTYKCFPPAYIADANGKPMHSWRVLILPYMERNDIYDKYDFTEPWDGPNNRKLASQIDSLFCCPEPSGGPEETNYLAVVDPETGWPGATPRKIRDIRDGTSKTIALVEVANSGIHWMEPRDLTLAEALKGINAPGPGLTISSHHPGGANVGWFDAHVSLLSNTTSIKLLRGLLTAAGGEPVSDPGQ
jgi:prepilin-type processing-associated H-X9-DG protein